MSTRIKADPGKKVPKEGLEGLPSIFVDKALIQKIVDEVRDSKNGMSKYAHENILRAVIHLAALGIPNAQIARSLQIPVPSVARILKAESVSREVERIQIQHYNRDVETMFKRLVPTAVKTIFDKMTRKSVKDSTSLEAAKYVVDRAHGKPKETHAVQADMLAEVFRTLKNPPKNPASQTDILDAEFESVATTGGEPTDPLDKIVGDKA